MQDNFNALYKVQQEPGNGQAFNDSTGKIAFRAAVKHLAGLLYSFVAAHAATTAFVAIVAVATGGIGAVPALIVYRAGNFAILYATKSAAHVIAESSWDSACQGVHQN